MSRYAAWDHANAAALADGLGGLDWLDVQAPSTNMVFATMTAGDPQGLVAHLEAEGISILPGPKLRLVTHLDVNTDHITTACRHFQTFRR